MTATRFAPGGPQAAGPFLWLLFRHTFFLTSLV